MKGGREVRKMAILLLVSGLALAGGAAVAGPGHPPGASLHLRVTPWILLLPLLGDFDDRTYAPAVAMTPGTYLAPTPDEAAIAQFQRFNPCPSTGATTGPCPGYVLAPIDPMRSIAADHGLNLQWVGERREMP